MFVKSRVPAEATLLRYTKLYAVAQRQGPFNEILVVLFFCIFAIRYSLWLESVIDSEVAAVLGRDGPSCCSQDPVWVVIRDSGRVLRVPESLKT